MALTPGTRLGPYEITAQIGAGGMGEVYRARDTRLKRDVALKILPESFATDSDRLARFQREAEVLASLNHPNIAHIHGLEESNGTRALVMELVDGETLADRIARGPIPIDEALPIAKQIAEALEAAHEQRIIHRDLKPANIKVRADGTVKVLDFGLAKALEAKPAAGVNVTASPTITSPAMMTGVGVLLGTAAYMSPEQARGKAVDKRSDIWAFGCVLFEMLTGKRAFEGEDVSDTLAFVLTKEPDWTTLPAGLASSVRALLRRCLERDVRKRVADASTLLFVLDEAATGPAEAGHFVRDERDARRLWRRALPAATAALGAALLVGVAVWWMLRPAPPRIVRAEISAAGAMALNILSGDRHLVLTPDGSRLIYRGNGQLLVRGLDQLEPDVLTGLGDPRGVFVSPDGQWIGYFDGNQAIKKVTITGGPAVMISRLDGASSRGAAWAPDGTIYFGTTGFETGIQRVPAEGGDSTVVTKPNRDQGEADHLWPELLPGGRALLFTISALAGGTDSAQIAVLDLASGTYKVVIRGGTHAHYVPTGHLVYAAGGTLRAVPFDIKRMEAAGNAVPVVEDVVTLPDGGMDATIADNGTIVYARGRGTPGALPRSIVWVDRSGREEPLKTGVRLFVSPRLSPDALHAAFQIADEGDDVWTLDLVRGALTRQTFERVEDETPAWSPDGKWIAYASTEKGLSTVFRRRTDGTGTPEAVWSASSSQVHTHVEDWSPDGGTLLISRVGMPDSPRSDIAALNVKAGDRNATPLLRSAFNMLEARISPDGRWIAYSSNESGRYEVYVTSFPSLGGKWQISTGGGREPVWSRRGDELFYRGEGSLQAVRVSTATSFSTGPPQKLVEDHFAVVGGHIGYDVSHDGQRFLTLKEESFVPAQIVLVENWFEELKRLVPTP